ARRWLRGGLRLLKRETERQILADGVHAELSVFYQRMILEALLEFIALAERNHFRLPEVIPDRARRMHSFLVGICRPDGQFPLLGDGFRSDVLLRFDVLAAGAALLNGMDETDATGYAPSPDHCHMNHRTLCLLNGRMPRCSLTA
ncbi:MAG: hypothetical protein HQK60_15600, partial [Deltaproteobacteria bacterium]|nr:hypothetical protein [Deltaproteobacteria bacterium]